MIGRDGLTNFKKMWTWLSGYPAYDREYYMKNVAKLDKKWLNSCPLSNKSEDKNCDGCKMLCKSNKGTLCTDPGAPVHMWNTTEIDYPHDRAFYASQAAVLAMKAIHSLEA